MNTKYVLALVVVSAALAACVAQPAPVLAVGPSARDAAEPTYPDASSQRSPSTAAVASEPETSPVNDPGRPTALVAKSGRVALSSFALAGRVGWESLRTVGRAAGGLVTGGTQGARDGWRSGVSQMCDVARAEADHVKTAARQP